MSVVKYNFISKTPLKDLAGNGLDASLESKGDSFDDGLILNENTVLKIPLFKSDIDVLPEVFTISFVISLTDSHYEAKDNFVYWSTISYGPLDIGMGIDTESGHLMIKNINKDWLPLRIQTKLDGPCGMVKDVSYQISITINMQKLKFGIVCNGSPLLYMNLPKSVSQKEITYITDIQIGGNGNFVMRFFHIYAGAFESAEVEYASASIQIYSNNLLLGKFIQAPSFSVKVGGILELDEKTTFSTKIPTRLKALKLRNVPDQTNPLEIIIAESSAIRTVVPILTSTSLWIFPKIESRDSVTIMTFEYKCLSSGPVKVTAVFPDIWTTLEWEYECLRIVTPKNMMKMIDGKLVLC
jgi:hypothetical protein